MLKQSLQQKLLQKLSPQQIQLMKLLQVPTAMLENRIKEELEINPALEENIEYNNEEGDSNENDLNYDDSYEHDEHDEHDENKREDFSLDQYMYDDEVPSYKTSIQSGDDNEQKEIPFTGGISFQEQLTEQLHLKNLNAHQSKIADYIIGCIDDDGYMRREIAAMVDDLAFTQNIQTTEKELILILGEIQDLDPPGIGARDLQECLYLQLKRKENRNKAIRLATEIISKMMEEFSKKHYDKIAHKLELTPEEMKLAIDEILHLNPKPGNSQADSSKNIEQITPDFVLYNNDGKLELTLNSKNRVSLKISKDYNSMLTTYGKNKRNVKDKEAFDFIKQKIDNASWFIDALEQRNQSMMLVMTFILDKQNEYFLDGDETKLKPMILKDIADATNLDISTVSRISNSKYIQTHFGTFALKSFYSEGIATDSGEEVSSKEVKKILSDAIVEENKSDPLSDEELVVVLKNKGYNIARRTVAKYRDMLNIPVARLRKKL